MDRLLPILLAGCMGAWGLLAGAPQAPAGQPDPFGPESRVALIIGNGAYQEAPLKNPVNDARAVDGVLREFGFTVTRLENLDYRHMTEAVRAFRNQLAAGRGTGIFFFAGHGVSLGGKNYLLPVGELFESEGDVEFRAMEAGYVLRAMEEAGARVSILMLDACRNNPFGDKSFNRGGARGLAIMEPPHGSLVAFATAPGSVAADGDGANGLYTRELVRTIREQPGVEVEQLLKTVGARVLQASGGKQVPYRSSSLTGSFYFGAVGPSSVAGAGTPTAPPLAELQPVAAYAPPARESPVGCSVAVSFARPLLNSPNRNLYLNETREAVQNHDGIRYHDILSPATGLPLEQQLGLARNAKSSLLVTLEHLSGSTVFTWNEKFSFYCVKSGQLLFDWNVDSKTVRTGWAVKKELFNPAIHAKLQEAMAALGPGCLTN